MMIKLILLRIGYMLGFRKWFMCTIFFNYEINLRGLNINVFIYRGGS